jgi:hypothetical protein
MLVVILVDTIFDIRYSFLDGKKQKWPIRSAFAEPQWTQNPNNGGSPARSQTRLENLNRAEAGLRPASKARIERCEEQAWKDFRPGGAADYRCGNAPY